MTTMTLCPPTFVADTKTSTKTGSSVRLGALGGVVRFVVQVLAWMVIVVLLGVLAATVAVPRVTGATPYTVLTGSMAPTYPPGTLVVDKPVSPSEIHLGDAVTFQIASGKPDVVTHRVVGIRLDATGSPEFLTKGDANQVNDPDWRPAGAVRGRVWYAAPELGRVNTLITGHQRQLAVYGVAAGLVLYAASMFLGVLRSTRRRRRTNTTTAVSTVSTASSHRA
jgi:signal peptidase